LATSLASAQSICVTGEVERVGGVTICQVGYRIAGTQVYLRSSTVSLANHVGHVVELEGTDISSTCRVLDVNQVLDPAPVTLTRCGSPMLQCPLKVVLQGPGLGFALLALSPGSAFLPLGCSANPGDLHGSLLLAPPLEVLLAVQTSTGRIEQTIPIPLVHQLVGVSVRFQGAHMTLGRQGPLRFSNAESVTIAPLLPPCAPTNC